MTNFALIALMVSAPMVAHEAADQTLRGSAVAVERQIDSDVLAVEPVASVTTVTVTSEGPCLPACGDGFDDPRGQDLACPR